MRYNTTMLSCLREAKALSKERHNPTVKLVRLINQYHSIDMMYGSVEQKSFLRDDLRNLIFRTAYHVPVHLRARVPHWLDSKDEWEYSRERIHI